MTKISALLICTISALSGCSPINPSLKPTLPSIYVQERKAIKVAIVIPDSTKNFTAMAVNIPAGFSFSQASYGRLFEQTTREALSKFYDDVSVVSSGSNLDGYDAILEASLSHMSYDSRRLSSTGTVQIEGSLHALDKTGRETWRSSITSRSVEFGATTLTEGLARSMISKMSGSVEPGELIGGNISKAMGEFVMAWASELATVPVHKWAKAGGRDMGLTTQTDSNRPEVQVSVSQADQRGVQIEGRLPEFVTSQYGRAWAVVIGINDYRNNIPHLKYAVADAKAVGAALQAQGFSVVGLYNEQATRSRILEVLGDELPEKVKRGDRVAIFYAGHGDTKTVEGAQEMGYLLPVDAQRERLHKTSINMGEIRQLAAMLPAKHVLFMVDVCYGGIAGTQFRSLPPQTAAYFKQITKERGRQLITAGGAGQQVVEGPQWGHSVFTYYLLEGLKGLADLNDDGIIPASELYTFLDGRVPAAADNQQRPELWSLAADKGEFVFLTPKAIETKPASK